MGSKGWFLTSGLAILIGSSLPASAADTTSLHYAFNGINQAVYRISVTSDLPDHIQHTTAYICFTPSPSGDQITMPYRLEMRNMRSQPGNLDATFNPPDSLFQPPDGSQKVVIDRFGKIVESHTGRQGLLTGTAGSCWQLPLPQLSPSNQSNWDETQPITLVEQQTQRGWPPRPMFFQQTPETDLSAVRTVHYTTAAVQNSSATVNFTVDLATDEKTNGVPTEHDSGHGSFQFDATKGLLTSLSAQLTDEINIHDVTAKIPVTVDLQLLTSDQLAPMRAAAAEQSKKDAAQLAQWKTDHRLEVNSLPADTVKTAMVGGQGGGTFMLVNPDLSPVLGFRIKLGSWDNHGTLSEVMPLYEKPNTSHPDGQTVIFAKDGYAVGGVWMNGDTQAHAMRVIFMKKTDDGLDPKQYYMSHWFGELVGPSRVKLAGNGQAVVGIFGRKGLNIDAMGLVVAGDAPDPTDDPNFKGTPAQ